jgi:hypothetical protein
LKFSAKPSTPSTTRTVFDDGRVALLSAACFLAASAVWAADSSGAKTFPAASVKNIVVETAGGPIALTASEDKQLATDVAPAAKPGDECLIERTLSGTTLTLQARGAPSGGILSRFMASYKPCSAGFTISAPARVAIAARSGSGKIDVGAFSGQVDAKTGSGAIELHGTTGELTLRSGSGTISGDAGGQKSLDVATGSGGIDLRELTGPVTARSGSGFVSLLWSAAPQSGDVDVRTGSGDITAILPKSARLSISFSSGSGSLNSDFQSDDRAPLHLTFRSGSGGARIKKAL